MPRILHYASFAIPGLLLLYGMHRYAWARLVRDPEPPRRARKVLTGLVAGLGVFLLLAFTLARQLPLAWAPPAALVAYTWLGLLFYLTLLLAALDLVRLAARLVRSRPTSPRPVEVDPERRRFLARAASGAAILGTGSIAVAGWKAVGEITTPELQVRLPKLPRALDGFRIVHLTDMHLGQILQGRFIEAVVEKTNALRPDLIVITGDMVDATVHRLGPALAPLGRLRARSGVAFVTGNHEYYYGAEDWVRYLREQGMNVLVNQRIEIGDSGPGGASFDLAGIPDHHASRFVADHEPDLAAALAGRDPERELVLLAHQPRQFELARGHGVGLQLSGHTHGGQTWPFGMLVGLVQPWIAGLHRADDGTQVYVSRGTGYWGPPMRIAAPAEIASIVLTV